MFFNRRKQFLKSNFTFKQGFNFISMIFLPKYATAIRIKQPLFSCVVKTESKSVSLQCGTGQGLHHPLRQRAGGGCFGHHLVLRSRHWPQYTHYGESRKRACQVLDINAQKKGKGLLHSSKSHFPLKNHPRIYWNHSITSVIGIKSSNNTWIQKYCP